MRHSAFVALVGLVSLNCIMGCGDGGAAKGPKLVPVSGTITRNGKPVEKAQVAFIHKDASRNAMGQTDAQGKFHLSTLGTNDGAILGDHIVIVSKTADGPPPSAGPPKPEDLAKMAAGGQMVAPKADASVPAKYADPKTTTLKATVKGDGKDDFPFELTD